MLRRHWRAILTGLGFATLAILLAGGYYYLESSEQQTYAPEKYQPARDARLPEVVKKSKTATKTYEPNCQAPQSKEDADLCAQWGAVQATSEANRLSRVGLRVTYLEFAALVVSLIFTGWAALAAAKATRIAEEATKDAGETMEIARVSAAASMRTADTAAEQVRLSREALILTERAYVTQTALEWAEVFDPSNGSIFAYKFGVRWENTGNTPAIGTITHLNMSIRPEEDPDVFDFSDFAEIVLVPKGIGPKAHVSSGQFVIPASQLDGVVTGIARFYLWGWYEYDDVFENTLRHRTEVALAINVDASVFPKTIRFVENSFGRFNGMDESCMKPPQTPKGGVGT